MNDKAVALLEQYDIEVLRTRKGRGAYLCETGQGVLIFKEYEGTEVRLQQQDALLRHIQSMGIVQVDQLLPAKSGELFVKDKDGVRYILKTYYEGRECNIYEKCECLTAMRLLAKLHNCMRDVPQLGIQTEVTGGESGDAPTRMLQMVQEKESSDESGKSQAENAQNPVLQEYERHNQELVRVRNFLRKRKQKQPFERRLYGVMDAYIEQARSITEGWRKYVQDLDLTEPTNTYYHGSYQYHNIIFYEKDWYIINFEKCQPGSQVKDVYLLLRKVLEKSDWQPALGKALLDAYKQLRPFSALEALDLYYRLAYPEKFWKIVNFYNNSAKVWIPERNMEKLEKLLEQEQNRQSFLEEVFRPEYL